MIKEDFWPLLLGALLWFFPRPYAAQDRLISSFADMAADVDNRPDVCQYVQDRIRYLTSQNISFRSPGSDGVQVMFGRSLINSIPAVYLALLHVLAEPGLVDEVRTELQESGYQQALEAAGDENEPKPDLRAIIPGKLPLLRSIWSETLRMHSNSLTVREVTAPTQLAGKNGQTWHLQKGGVVSIPCCLIHYDERLHPNPNGFHARRFMDKAQSGEGESAAKTTKPFGGGINHCPGRIFGEKQWMAIMSGLIWRYDSKVVSDKWEIPTIGEFDTLAKEPVVWLEFGKRKI